MIRLLRPIVLFAMGLFPFAGAAEPKGELILAAEGRARYTITLRPSVSKCVRTLAERLSETLEQVSGAPFAIVEAASPRGPHIRLIARAAASEIPGAGVVTVKTQGRDVLLAGDGHLELSYACDLFLKKLGVRWYTPDPLGHHVPKKSTLAVGPLNIERRPDFAIRCVGDNEWSLHNYCNVGLKGLVDGISGFTIWGRYHTFQHMLPKRVFFKAHPEYYSLVTGRRQFGPTDGQLNLAHPEVVRHVARSIRRIARDDPSVRLVTVCPEDQSYFNQSPTERALDIPGAPQHGLYTNRLYHFYENVAERTSRACPHVALRIGAYAQYQDPILDNTIQLPGNVVLFLAGIFRCQFHPVHASCPSNAAFRKLLAQWQSKVNRVLVYEYFTKGMWGEMVWPIARNAADAVRFYRRRGVEGLYTQYPDLRGTRLSSPWASDNANSMQGLVWYVLAELLWDSEQDVDALIGDFFANYFAEAGGPMREYYDLMESTFTDASIHSPGKHDVAKRVFTPDVMAKAERLLDRAQAAAESDVVRRRVAGWRLSFDYTQAFLATVKAKSLAEFTERYKATVRLSRRGVEMRAISKHGIGQLARAMNQRLPRGLSRATLEMLLRDAETKWIKPAARLRPLKVGFVLHEKAAAEERAALRWATCRFEHVLPLRVRSGKIESRTGAPWQDMDVLWIHSDSPKRLSQLNAPSVASEIRRLMQRGVGVLLSGDAVYCSWFWKFEPVRPGTSSLTNYERTLGFKIVDGRHPVWSGLQTVGRKAADGLADKQVLLRWVTRNERWGEPRWRVPDRIAGKLLATPLRYPGKTLVEHEHGKGKLIVAGIPYWGVFSDTHNPFWPNVDRLTLNIVQYLGGKQRRKIKPSRGH